MAPLADPFPKRSVRYTASGTAALTAIIEHAELAGGRVLLPAFICRGSFESTFRSYDIEPVFVDVDSDSLHLSRDIPNREFDAILLDHAFGVPASVSAWTTLADRLDVPLIEDCARALGATEEGDPVGSSGDYALYSVPKVTPISTGGALIGLPPDTSLPPTPIHRGVLRVIGDRFGRHHPWLHRFRPWYHHLLGSHSAPEVTAAPTPAAMDAITRLRFDRYRFEAFADTIERHRRIATGLRAVVSHHGFGVQQWRPGTVAHELQTWVPHSRSELVAHLRSQDCPVYTVWSDPWGLDHGRFPVTEFLAKHVITFRLKDWSADSVTTLDRTLAASTIVNASDPLWEQPSPGE